MDENRWTAVDDYFGALFAGEDEVLASALAASDAAGLPPINVAPNQGKLLMILAGLVGARRILEIGTLAGYSTIWLARALPAEGRLVTLELDPRHAAVARANFARAGLAERIDLRIGPAIDSLPAIAAEAGPPFDFVFIDADKTNNPAYLDWALKLTRAGGVIVLDNVVRDGRITDAGSADPSVVGTRRALAQIAADPRLEATALQTVGMKGWDGLAIARVRS